MKLRNRAAAIVGGTLIAVIALAGLESATYISDLVITNPVSSDPANQGDDHIRLLKTAIKNTFPNINNVVNLSDENLNDAALKAATNTFTGVNNFNNGATGIAINSTTPRILLNDTNAGVDLDIWRIQPESTAFVIGTRTDADGAGADFLTAIRSGTTVTSINLAATSVQANGVPVSTLKHAACTINTIGTVTNVSGCTSATHDGTGQFTLNYTAAGFTGNPACTITPDISTGSGIALTGSSTTTTMVYFTRDLTPAAADLAVRVNCTGI